MEELKRFEADLRKDDELKQKYEAALRRLAEEKACDNDGDLVVKAAAELGYVFSLGDLQRSQAEMEELDPGELSHTAGGEDVGKGGCWSDYWCILNYRTSNEDEYGHDGFCYVSWHCYAAILHTESKELNDTCWTDYKCILISYHDR